MSDFDSWSTARIEELLSDITELSSIDYEAVGEIIFDMWNPDSQTAYDIHYLLTDYFTALATTQAETEWGRFTNLNRGE